MVPQEKLPDRIPVRHTPSSQRDLNGLHERYREDTDPLFTRLLVELELGYPPNDRNVVVTVGSLRAWRVLHPDYDDNSDWEFEDENLETELDPPGYVLRGYVRHGRPNPGDEQASWFECRGISRWDAEEALY